MIKLFLAGLLMTLFVTGPAFAAKISDCAAELADSRAMIKFKDFPLELNFATFKVKWRDDEFLASREQLQILAFLASHPNQSYAFRDLDLLLGLKRSFNRRTNYDAVMGLIRRFRWGDARFNGMHTALSHVYWNGVRTGPQLSETVSVTPAISLGLKFSIMTWGKCEVKLSPPQMNLMSAIAASENFSLNVKDASSFIWSHNADHLSTLDAEIEVAKVVRAIQGKVRACSTDDRQLVQTGGRVFLVDR